MKLNYRILLILSLVYHFSLAQENFVKVNQFTGTASVNIPLFNLKLGNANLPVTLSYAALGLKISSAEGNAGTGWNVSTGGAIVRILRGLPDDSKTDSLGNARLGWLYNNNGPLIEQFSIKNDNSQSTDANQTADINYIASNFDNTSDTEPDMFVVNAPGLNCKFIFDKNHTIHTIPYVDVVITPTYNSNGSIIAFSVINDQGVTYNFANPQLASKTIAGPTPTYSFLSSPYYFVIPFTQYRFDVKYASAWNLTSVSDANNNVITLNYTPGKQISATSIVCLNGGMAAPAIVHGFVSTTYTMSVNETSTPNLLSNITYNNGLGGTPTIIVNFNYRVNANGSLLYTSSNRACLASVQGFGRTILFNYITVIPNDDYTAYSDGLYESSSAAAAYAAYVQKFSRMFLSNISEQDCSSPFNYSFSYNGITAGEFSILGGTPYGGNTTYYPSNLIELLPGTDYWGFNGAGYPARGSNPQGYPDVRYTGISGHDMFRNNIANITTVVPYFICDSSLFYGGAGLGVSRRVIPGRTVTGALSQITYPQGGYTMLTYEPNDYFDNDAQAVVQGGGIRIKQIVHSDNFNPDHNIITNYSYVDPATNLSSGKPISLPIFAFQSEFVNPTASISTSHDAMACFTWSNNDLSTEDHSVVYSVVQQSQPGQGTTAFKYSNPATHWDPSFSSPLSWSPTMVYRAKISTPTGNNDLVNFRVTNTINTYPFPPNPNYDFERGMLTSLTKYDANNNMVSEDDYSYQTPNTAVAITGFKYDYQQGPAFNGTIPKSIAYAKYTIYASTGPLLMQLTHKFYNSGSSPLQTVTNYIYNPQNKVAQQSVINSDGSAQTTNTKYVKDYTIGSSTNDAYTSALLSLQQLNINDAVENYHQVTYVGNSTPITTNGDLIKFASCSLIGGGTLIEPVQKLSFSSTATNSFQPSSVSNGTFLNDNNYVVVENDLGYDGYGNLITKDDGFKHIVTALYDTKTSNPVATFTNARYDEVGFSDFDSQTTGAFIPYRTNGAPIELSTGRVGRGEFLQPGNVLTKTVNKSSYSKYYITSFWINSSNTGLATVTISGNGVTNTSTVNFQNTTVTNPATGWQYFTMKIPVNNITSTGITINIITSQAINIDDILFYPDIATFSTSAFDPVTHLNIAKTDMNGSSMYLDVDPYGRIHHVYDQDKNIVIRKEYDPNGFYKNLSFTYSGNSSVATFTNTAVFSSSCTIVGPVTYTWNFGDNTTTVTTTSTSPVTHTYTSASPGYTVTLTATNSQMGTSTISEYVSLGP